MSGFLLARLAELEADFRGCGEHSRHKQAAEAWHYCAEQIAELIAKATQP